MLEIERLGFGRVRGSFSLLFSDLEIPRNDRMLEIIRTVVESWKVVEKKLYGVLTRKVLYMVSKVKAEYKR